MKRSKRVRTTKKAAPCNPAPVSLKALAEHLGLSSASVSLVINGSPAAKSIPAVTQDRIRSAARELNYRPNLMARSLRQKRSFTIGVIVPEISEGYAALVISGIEEYLFREGYFYFVVSHRHRPDLIAEYPALLQQRAVQGIIAIDTPCTAAYPPPTVAVSGDREVPGITNIALDHNVAACLAMRHLKGLGHKRIALLKGQVYSADSEVRWQSILHAARSFGIATQEELQFQLEEISSSPQVGYHAAQQLLARDQPFSALVAFNDNSAIGAIQAFREAGKQVPADISVIGFDDIVSAGFQNPGLTTIRQPLRQMGHIAAETLLRRITSPRSAYPRKIIVEPELVVRGTTARAR